MNITGEVFQICLDSIRFLHVVLLLPDQKQIADLADDVLGIHAPKCHMYLFGKRSLIILLCHILCQYRPTFFNILNNKNAEVYKTHPKILIP